jgi:LacI family transcriptional regulator
MLDHGNTTQQPQKVTIRDVAREANVALSTVSNALAGKSNVSQSTRLRVQEIAARLGYRASTVARALRMQRTFAVGVLMSDIANPSSPDFLRGIEDILDREQCSLLVCNTDEMLDKQLAHMRVLLDRQVDGLVMLSQHCEQPEVRAALQSGPPFVLLQRRTRANLDDYVGADNLQGIIAAARHLVDLGHRRIGFIRGPVESSAAEERLQAFRHAVETFGLDADPTLIVQGGYRAEHGYRAAGTFFGMRRRPSAILAANDMSAIGVLDRAGELGIAVPGEVSLIGLDDIMIAACGPIDLTTIHLPRREMGAAAANLLTQRIRGKPGGPPRQICFPMELVVRGSTGPAPRRRPARRQRSVVA